MLLRKPSKIKHKMTRHLLQNNKKKKILNHQRLYQLVGTKEIVMAMENVNMMEKDNFVNVKQALMDSRANLMLLNLPNNNK
jgi:hypothetical protein